MKTFSIQVVDDSVPDAKPVHLPTKHTWEEALQVAQERYGGYARVRIVEHHWDVVCSTPFIVNLED